MLMRQKPLILAAVFTMLSLGAAGTANALSICGKTWEKADSNDDGFVEKNEASKYASTAFAHLDDNADGFVTSDEWSKCSDLTAVSKALSATETTASQADQTATSLGTMHLSEMSRADADKSGNLSRREVRESMMQSAASAKGLSVDRVARYAGSWFDLHDENDDGRISLEELKTTKLSEKLVRRFADVDKDADGRISKREWSDYSVTRYDALRERASGGHPVTTWFFYGLTDD